MTIQNYNYYPLLTPVKLLSTVNITGSYNNGISNNGVESFLIVPQSTFSIDLVEVQLGDSVLLINQINKNENGIYICIQTGGIFSFSVLQRRPDFQSIEQIREGQFISIGDGEINKGELYTVISPLPNFLGIDPLLFVSTAPSFKVREFNETDFTPVTNLQIIPSFVGISAFSGIDYKFNNPINVINNPIDNQIASSVSVVELNGIIQGAISASGSIIISKGTFGPNGFGICNAITIDFVNGELNGGTIVGQFISIPPIQTPTNISNLSPRSVQNVSGISLPRVDNISGAFDYLITADNASNYFLTAGNAAGSAGDPTKCNANEVIKLKINGNDKFIPLFNSNS